MDILSNGKIYGECIVFDLDSFDDKIITDKIIVIKEITLEILPKLYSVKGIIVENGSILSHTSIILREIGIPMVKIKNATKIYKTGEIIDIK